MQLAQTIRPIVFIRTKIRSFRSPLRHAASQKLEPSRLFYGPGTIKHDFSFFAFFFFGPLVIRNAKATSVSASRMCWSPLSVLQQVNPLSPNQQATPSTSRGRNLLAPLAKALLPQNAGSPPSDTAFVRVGRKKIFPHVPAKKLPRHISSWREGLHHPQ